MNQVSDTVDLMKLIIRQKYLIVGIIVLAIILSVFLSLFTKRVYSIDSIVEIGNFVTTDGAVNPIESPNQLLEKINKSEYHCSPKDKQAVIKEVVCEINAKNPEGTNLVQIEAVSADVDQYKNLINDINQSILIEHNKRLDTRSGILMKNISALEKEIASLKYKSSYGPYTDGAISNLVIELVKREEQLSSFTPTIIVKEASGSSLPVNFNLFLTALFAAFVGLFLGLFAALCREWWIHHSLELGQ
jgi:uncharacterized protein involved in exopolysaccharide biosynthesis